MEASLLYLMGVVVADDQRRSKTGQNDPAVFDKAQCLLSS